MKIHTPLKLIITFLIVSISSLTYGQQSNDSTSNKSQSSGFKGFLERRQERLNKPLERQKNAEEEERLNEKLNKSISAGLELEKASRHLSYGFVLPVVSFIAASVLAKNYSESVGVGIVVGGTLVGLSYTVSGFTKMGKAGRILKERGL
jgi:lipopolysaccharide export LptBFGC system permease protein LptF